MIVGRVGIRPVRVVTLGLLISLAGAAGLAAQSATAPGGQAPALLPADLRAQTSVQLNTRGLALHRTQDYAGSARLFWFATIVAPKEARGHFNLACALSRLEMSAAAVVELQRAAEVDRAWTTPNLDDPDLDPIRFSTDYTRFITWFTGTRPLPVGSWTGGYVPWETHKPPRWLAPGEGTSTIGRYNGSQAGFNAAGLLHLTLGGASVLLDLTGQGTASGPFVTVDGWEAGEGPNGAVSTPRLIRLQLTRPSPDILQVEDITPGGPERGPLANGGIGAGPETFWRESAKDPVIALPGKLGALADRVPRGFPSSTSNGLAMAAATALARGEPDKGAYLALYAAFLDPKNWGARLLVARSFAAAGRHEAAAYELNDAQAAAGAAAGADFWRELEGREFDRARTLPAWSAMMSRAPSGGLAGTWSSRDVEPGQLPSWAPPSQLASPAVTLTLGSGGGLELEIAGGYSVLGAGQTVGSSFYWSGTIAAEQEDEDGAARSAKPLPVGGILELRLLAPDWLAVRTLAASDDLARIGPLATDKQGWMVLYRAG